MCNPDERQQGQSAKPLLVLLMPWLELEPGMTWSQRVHRHVPVGTLLRRMPDPAHPVIAAQRV